MSDDLTESQAVQTLQVESIAYNRGVATISAIAPKLNVNRTGELYTFGRSQCYGAFMIERYIAKHYEWPPCWQLVADVYINELGLSLDDYTPKQIQCAMWPMRLD